MKAVFKRELHDLLGQIKGWGFIALTLLSCSVVFLLHNVISVVQNPPSASIGAGATSTKSSTRPSSSTNLLA
ncbi:MAG: hypothetical protein IJJ23_01385, partial [Clostridia bacterium]|nr:hypothetical protein [Clostridia bacterium]